MYGEKFGDIVLEKFTDIKGHDATETGAEMTAFILDHNDVVFEPDNRFFCLSDVKESNVVGYSAIQARYEKAFAPKREDDKEEMLASTAFRMIFDVGHTTPNWSDVIALGFSGLKKRVEEAGNRDDLTDHQKRFYNSTLMVYEASERYLHRVIDKALEVGKTEIAESLKNLLVRPPQTLFEAMQMLLMYFTLQHRFENTWIRSYGRVDQLLYPFYLKEDKEVARQMVHDFIAELQCQNESANQPFSLGGSDKDGNDMVNELSYVFLEEYKKINPPWVKIHILCSDTMPESFMKSALDGIRNGANSMVFMGDTVMKKALKKLGIAEEDITDYHIDGCYECGGFGELTSPSTAKINIPKAVELVLNNGKDMKTGAQVGLSVENAIETFDDFYKEFHRQLTHICESAKYYVGKMEAEYPKSHAGLLFSSTYPNCVEDGKDIFADFGAKYNNSSITGSGLGTAVDSLMGVKKLVFDDKKMTLSELSDLMKNNWEGQEALRLTAKNKFPKYGMGDSSVDWYAADIVDRMGKLINGAPNVRGGTYRMGMYSITARWFFGAGLAATPDGRRAGETVSLNACASFGADREGTTGHILSVTTIDATNAPTAVVLDLDLHESAVRGENGLNAMYATLKTYLDRGGFAIHYNVLNADTLRAAQKKPEDYPNLQVRLCGWNVLFNRLDKRSQDEYIMRAESE